MQLLIGKKKKREEEKENAVTLGRTDDRDGWNDSKRSKIYMYLYSPRHNGLGHDARDTSKINEKVQTLHMLDYV